MSSDPKGPSDHLVRRYLRPYARGRVWGAGSVCRACGLRAWAVRRRQGVIVSHLGAGGAFTFCLAFLAERKAKARRARKKKAAIATAEVSHVA